MNRKRLSFLTLFFLFIISSGFIFENYDLDAEKFFQEKNKGLYHYKSNSNLR